MICCFHLQKQMPSWLNIHKRKESPTSMDNFSLSYLPSHWQSRIICIINFPIINLLFRLLSVCCCIFFEVFSRTDRRHLSTLALPLYSIYYRSCRSYRLFTNRSKFLSIWSESGTRKSLLWWCNSLRIYARNNQVSCIDCLVDEPWLNNLHFNGSWSWIYDNTKFLVERHLEWRPLKFDFLALCHLISIDINPNEIFFCLDLYSSEDLGLGSFSRWLLIDFDWSYSKIKWFPAVYLVLFSMEIKGHCFHARLPSDCFHFLPAV